LARPLDRSSFGSTFNLGLVVSTFDARQLVCTLTIIDSTHRSSQTELVRLTTSKVELWRFEINGQTKFTRAEG